MSRYPPVKERLIAGCTQNSNTGCWVWHKHKMYKGYGMLQVRGTNTLAHRAAFTEFVGAIPAGLIVRHKCDNPACINPEHLELGTPQDNSNDMKMRGRSNCIGHRHETKLTPKQVLEIFHAEGTQTSIAERYGIRQTAVSKIKLGQRWGDITG